MTYHVALVLTLRDELLIRVVVRKDGVCLILKHRVDPTVVDA